MFLKKCFLVYSIFIINCIKHLFAHLDKSIFLFYDVIYFFFKNILAYKKMLFLFLFNQIKITMY